MSGSYVKSITTPKNTPVTSPLETDLILSSGRIQEIKILFPPGCAALLRVQIKEYEQVIIPKEPDSYIAWDDYVWVIPVDIKLQKDTTKYSIVTWNLDVIYDHTILIAIEILPLALSLEERLSNIEKLIFTNSSMEL